MESRSSTWWGAPQGLRCDISERKRTEEQLLELQRELEELSFKDGLTDIAKRRRFDA